MRGGWCGDCCFHGDPSRRSQHCVNPKALSFELQYVGAPRSLVWDVRLRRAESGVDQAQGVVDPVVVGVLRQLLFQERSRCSNAEHQPIGHAGTERMKNAPASITESGLRRDARSRRTWRIYREAGPPPFNAADNTQHETDLFGLPLGPSVPVRRAFDYVNSCSTRLATASPNNISEILLLHSASVMAFDWLH